MCCVWAVNVCVWLCGCVGSSQLIYWLTQLYLVSLGCLLYTIYISTCNTSNVCQSTAMIRFDSDKYIRKIARKPQSHDSWYMMNNMIFTIYDNSSSNQSETNYIYNCCTRTFNSCCENVVFTSTDQKRQRAFNNIGRCRLHVYFQQKCMYLHAIIARILKMIVKYLKSEWKCLNIQLIDKFNNKNQNQKSLNDNWYCKHLTLGWLVT